MRLHRPAAVLVEHHEVLLPAVKRCEELLELGEAHLPREVPLEALGLRRSNSLFFNTSLGGNMQPQGTIGTNQTDVMSGKDTSSMAIMILHVSRLNAVNRKGTRGVSVVQLEARADEPSLTQVKGGASGWSQFVPSPPHAIKSYTLPL